MQPLPWLYAITGITTMIKRKNNMRDADFKLITILI